MKIDELIKECKSNLFQIENFEPDPYYVKYFLKLFLKYASKICDAVFEEKSNEFGLFGVDTKNKFRYQAVSKQDKKAIKFSDWFDKKFHDEHQSVYPDFMLNLIKLQEKGKEIPRIQIMLRPKEQYVNDIYQEILPKMINGKLQSKEELFVEIKRNASIFLEIVNHKRKLNNQSKINEKQIMTVTCMKFNEENFEIIHACKTYLTVLNRIIIESEKEKNIIIKSNLTDII